MQDAELDYLGVERWQELDDWPGYYVSTHGRVRGRRGKVLKPFSCSRGYWRVTVHCDGRKANVRLHRLVAETFIPNPDDMEQVHHKNHDTEDNRIENLEWCTNEDNAQYRHMAGRY